MTGHINQGTDYGQPGVSLIGWGTIILRALGISYQNPQVLTTATASDGSYTDVTVSLPNGGTLTTPKAAWGLTNPGTIHEQLIGINGLELARGAWAGNRTILTRNGTSGTAQATVAITDSGSGSPRTGTFRITWTTPVEDGHLLGYQYGGVNYNAPGNQSTNATAQFPFFEILVERIASLEDSSTPFFYPGIPVQFLDTTLTLTRGGGTPNPVAQWAVTGGEGEVTITNRPDITAPSVTGGEGEVTVTG
jgi:hypothetical protein